jgi:hypothetical protein
VKSHPSALTSPIKILPFSSLMGKLDEEKGLVAIRKRLVY